MNWFQKVMIVVSGALFVSTYANAEHIWVGLYAKGTKMTAQSLVSREYVSDMGDAIETEWKKASV